jgi:hypothetical protein
MYREILNKLTKNELCAISSNISCLYFGWSGWCLGMQSIVDNIGNVKVFRDNNFFCFVRVSCKKGYRFPKRFADKNVKMVIRN